LLSNEHLREVGLFEEYDHPSEGRMRQVRQPVTATGVERQADAPAPMVGQHSSEVLRDFGISADSKSLRIAQYVHRLLERRQARVSVSCLRA